LHQLVQDLRFSLRMLRRNPWFTAIAVLAMGLGIGASTGLFSLMDAVLLRPMPGIVRPADLVTFERWQAGQLLGNLGYPDYLDYAERLGSFSGVAAEAGSRLSFARGERVERVAGALVSGSYFTLLGVKPAAGRILMPEDEREDREVAVLSFPFWERAFGKEAGIVGGRIWLNGRLFTVVGVAQGNFRGTNPEFPPDLWLPITQAPAAMPRLSAGVLRNRAPGWLRIIGRLGPGDSLPKAQAEVNRTAAQLADEHPVTNHARSVALIEGLGMLSDDRRQWQRFLALLLVSVGLLQLLACANVANLLLARGAARQREIAVRLALGANRRQLMRLFLMEGALLAGMAAALGVLLAPALAQLAAALPQASSALRQASLQLDWRVLDRKSVV
jgi:macrolide transport system ATP-binding/permease protein